MVRSLDLETGVECILIGTLYKDMCLKPSVLAEYTKVVSDSLALVDLTTVYRRPEVVPPLVYLLDTLPSSLAERGEVAGEEPGLGV